MEWLLAIHDVKTTIHDLKIIIHGIPGRHSRMSPIAFRISSIAFRMSLIAFRMSKRSCMASFHTIRDVETAIHDRVATAEGVAAPTTLRTEWGPWLMPGFGWRFGRGPSR